MSWKSSCEQLVEELRAGKGRRGRHMAARVGERSCCLSIDPLVMIVAIDVLIRSGYHDLHESRIKQQAI
jgi:hypothetical protein